MLWELKSKDGTISILIDSQNSHRMVGLHIDKLPSSGVIDLNQIKGAENIRTIECVCVTVPFDSTKTINKLILPKNAEDVICMKLIHFEEGNDVMDSDWKGLELEELVWPDRADTIHSHFGETCSFNSISNTAAISVIEEHAFEISNITEFTVPPKVKEIPAYCFHQSHLKEINGLENIETVGEGAFDGCVCLRKICWSSKCTDIPDYCFMHCVNLTEIENIDNVESIGERAFQECSIKHFRWPAKCSTVSFMCFCGSRIEEISGTEEIESIEMGAFSYCNSLKEFRWPVNCRTVSTGCFSDCSQLVKVSNLDNVYAIDEEAFEASGLTEMDLSSSICLSIGEHAFAHSKIERFVPGYYTMSIDKTAFADTAIS